MIQKISSSASRGRIQIRVARRSDKTMVVTTKAVTLTATIVGARDSCASSAFKDMLLESAMSSTAACEREGMSREISHELNKYSFSMWSRLGRPLKECNEAMTILMSVGRRYTGQLPSGVEANARCRRRFYAMPCRS